MREGKIHKELPSEISKTKQKEGLKFVDSRPLNITQAKLIDTIQREPMELDDFKSRYKNLFEKYFSLGGNLIYRFTSNPKEEIGLVTAPWHVLDQITGEARGVKPLSFGYNLDALIATALSECGDENILKYAQNADYLCSIDTGGYSTLKENGFIICTGTSNELTVFETECVLGVITQDMHTSLYEMKQNSKYGQYIRIEENPMKGICVSPNQSILFIIDLIRSYKGGKRLSTGIATRSAENAMNWLGMNLDELIINRLSNSNMAGKDGEIDPLKTEEADPKLKHLLPDKE